MPDYSVNATFQVATVLISLSLDFLHGLDPESRSQQFQSPSLDSRGPQA
jgi:hypothetical protein